MTGDTKSALSATEMELVRRAEKRELRARILEIRRALPLESRAGLSRAICERVIQLPWFDRAETIVAYVAWDNEADPAAVLETALGKSKTVGLPRVETETNLLSFRRWMPGEPLEKSGLGVMEPLESASRLQISESTMALVPALAIDPRGYRIGYGKGFYDRFLAICTGVMSVGIAYDFQFIPESPATPGDVPVSAVVTDKRTLYTERNR